MVTAEMASVAKVGGLGDVAAALSQALARRGHDVRVVMPLYGELDREKLGIKILKKLPPLAVRIGQRVYDFKIHMCGSPRAAVKIYMVECAALYGRPGIYTDSAGKGFVDSLERASLHSQAALMLPRLLDWPVDVIHCHDAEAAPALLYRRQWYAGRQVPGVGGSLLTIHNLSHQEINPSAGVHILGLPEAMVKYPGLLEFHGKMNLLKAGILSADLVNTVSPTYAAETTADPVFGCGLEGVLLSRKKDYSGILNGADYDTWKTRGNKFLPAAYDVDDLSGKTVCRRALAKELGLEVMDNKPLCGLVGRLVQQKGIDLVIPLMKRLTADGFTFAILGTGEKVYEKALRKLADAHPGNIAYIQEFNEDLAHRIYAGSDLFLMPSHFEPCGLSQLYALRYGTPPVVRHTGGLADTVKDATNEKGTGFVFKAPTSPALLAALRSAEKVFADPEQWQNLQTLGMTCDFGWEQAAAEYEVIYGRLSVDGKA